MLLFEQRVAARQHDHVQRETRHHLQADRLFIDAQTDRAAHALFAQVGQRGQRLVHRLAPYRRVVRAVRQFTDVMQQQDVDVVGAKPAQAGLQRAQDAIAAVVEARAPSIHHETIRVIVPAGIAFDDPADLGRQGEAVAVDIVQCFADAAFAEPVTVVGRSVKMADAQFPRPPHRLGGLVVGDDPVQVADGCAAERQPRKRLGERLGWWAACR